MATDQANNDILQQAEVLFHQGQFPAASQLLWDSSISYDYRCRSVFLQHVPVPGVRIPASWAEDSEWGLRLRRLAAHARLWRAGRIRRAAPHCATPRIGISLLRTPSATSIRASTTRSSRTAPQSTTPEICTSLFSEVRRLWLVITPRSVVNSSPCRCPGLASPFVLIVEAAIQACMETPGMPGVKIGRYWERIARVWTHFWHPLKSPKD